MSRGTFTPHQYQRTQGRLLGLSGVFGPHHKQDSLSSHNATAMYYINKQGAAHSLHPTPHVRRQSIWKFCISHSVSLEASYLPGAQNQLADCLSRSFSSHREWSLHPDIARDIFQKWGTPHVDLFATHYNRKCQQFCSLGVTAPGLLWTPFLFYAFPPFC